MLRRFVAVFVSVLLLFSFASVLFVVEVGAGTPAGTITYDVGTDTITVAAANSSHPAEFLDVYNADVAGGWGQVTKQGNQYYFVCRLVIGNGSATYFTDKQKDVTFDTGALSGNDQDCIKVNNGAVFTLGVLVDADDKTTSDGCTLTFLDVTYWGRMVDLYGQDTAVANLYSCTIQALRQQYNFVIVNDLCKIYNCMFIGGFELALAAGDINNLWISSTSYALFQVLDGSEFSGVRTFDCESVFEMYPGQSCTARDFVAVGNTYVSYCANWDGELFLVNCDLDSWGIVWSGSCSGEIYRQYEFDLFVLNGEVTDFVEGANVTLRHDGAVVGSWLANSSGQIPTQTLTYGFYNQTGGDTMYGGTAWNLTVTDHEWQTYTSSFYPMSEIDWSISMQNRTVLSGNATADDVLVGHSFYNDSLELRVGSASLTNHTISNYELSGDWVSIRNYVGLGAVVCVLGVMVVFVARKRR